MVKASSKLKKDTKRGRPKKEGLLREPNGRISRSKKAIYKLALEVRAKKYNLTLEQAADPRSETYIGRLAILGSTEGLSQEQYDAALTFLKIRNDHKKAMLSPDAYYESRALGVRDALNEDYNKWVKRVNKRYYDALKAIEEAQFDNAHENLYAALQYVIIENQELPHLLGPARMILNALHRHYNAINKKPARPRYYDISLANLKRKSSKDFIVNENFYLSSDEFFEGKKVKQSKLSTNSKKSLSF